jgi:nucleoside-diphosphate-sugar epimerase
MTSNRITILRLAGLWGNERSLKNLYSRYLHDPIIPKNVNFIHVEQAAYAIKYAIEHHLKGIYNVASLSSLNTNIIEKLFGKKPEISKEKARVSPYGGSKVVDSSKLLYQPLFKFPNFELS